LEPDKLACAFLTGSGGSNSKENVRREAVHYRKEKSVMPIKNPKELFVMLLSNVREGNEHTTKIYQELIPMVKDADVKEALEARVFVTKQINDTLDQCFKVIGEKPVKLSGHLADVFMEDFRRELNEIQSPEAKLLFILAKVNQLIHLRIGEYVALIAAADLTGHYAAGVLLESCLAEKLAFVERTRRLIRERAKARFATA
jgi:ferritin-like metal-binding protein YciE